jgi:predicted ABC-type ATPase
MSRATPRLRMFAGPNGSGKSTIKAVVEADPTKQKSSSFSKQ